MGGQSLTSYSPLSNGHNGKSALLLMRPTTQRSLNQAASTDTGSGHICHTYEDTGPAERV